MTFPGNSIDLGQIVGNADHLRLTPEQRSKHLYVVGATGTGKSKFLENAIRQDILNWSKSRCGLMLLDPHGSVYQALMDWLAYIRPKVPIIPIDLREDSWVIAYNMLRVRKEGRPEVVVNNFVNTLAHVWGASNTDATPRFAAWATNILQLLLDNGLTLTDGEMLLFTAAKEIRNVLAAKVSSDRIRMAWHELNALSVDEMKSRVESTESRLTRFWSSPYLRVCFGQTGSSLDLRKAIEEGWIILAALAVEKGNVKQDDIGLYGSLLLSDLWNAATMRGKPTLGYHKPFYLYIDEFQRFITPAIADNLDQARGFGLHLTMAHQFPSQLTGTPIGDKIYGSVMNNARSKVVFKMDFPKEAEPLAQCLFAGTFDPDQIKLKLNATKVIGYEKAWQTARSEGGSSTSGDSFSIGEGYEPDDLDELDPLSRSRSEGGSSSSTESWSSTSTEVLQPILGQEVSSVQFRSFEEQMQIAMMALFDQQTQFCCARVDGSRMPLALRTPTVNTIALSSGVVRKYWEGLLRKCDFAIPWADAVAQMESRQAALIQQVRGFSLASAEPETARRLVNKSEKPQITNAQLDNVAFKPTDSP